ncbi:hypothetical protein [Thalassospira xiamenensis]|uniref:hypothetical protein n=1 Tax=Thalassospira xiamenensis TaxID=220697 RepID=UPI0011BDC818|nr:hypothetical protein [Thalassospira xiamenensis]
MGKQSQPIWKKFSLKIWALIGFVSLGILDRLITWGVNKVIDEKTWSYSWEFVAWIWELSWTPISIPAWILFLLTAVALAVIGVTIYSYFEPKDNFSPYDWQNNYTSDEVYGLRWFWRWSLGQMVGYPVPLCPKCSGELDQYAYGQSTKCASCSQSYPFPRGASDFGTLTRLAQAEIVRRVRSGEFVEIVKRQRQERQN